MKFKNILPAPWIIAEADDKYWYMHLLDSFIRNDVKEDQKKPQRQKKREIGHRLK